MARHSDNAPDVIDISLSELRRKKFRIDGDDSRILELNTTDLNLLSRLKEAYPKLISLSEDAVKNLPDDAFLADDNTNFFTDEAVASVVDTLAKIDTDMRSLLDYIFDSNVAEICAPSGSMYDPVNGKFRFEHIIETLTKLYTDDISVEAGNISKRVQKHTDKYVKSKK